jgi:putative transposase
LNVKTATELSESEREQAMGRFRVIEPHIYGGRALRTVAREAEVPYRTAWRWRELYREHGLAGLARKARTDRGRRRVLSHEMREAIEGLALERPTLPVQAIWRQVAHFAESRGEAKPSYSVVRSTIRALPDSLMTLAQLGEKVYSDRYDLVHRREAAGPNAVWQADHSQLNIPVLREDGTVAKPWLTVVLDDYSRAVAGYYLSFEAPSVLRTSLALRQAIWRKSEPGWAISGIPEVLYTDNGSDFRSRHMEQVAVDLKMQLVFSLTGRPRGRGRIERFFQTLEEMFLSDLEGYVRRSRRSAALTLAELDRQLRTFLLEVYHRRVGASMVSTPAERWEAGRFLPRMPASLEQLDLLLLHVLRTRRVRRDGVHFEGLRYLSPVLAAYEVTVRYDPRDMGEIRVFHQDRFLCRAITAEPAGEAVGLREIVRARTLRRRELRATLVDRRQAVDTLLALRRGVPQVETIDDVQPSAPTLPPLKRYWKE